MTNCPCASTEVLSLIHNGAENRRQRSRNNENGGVASDRSGTVDLRGRGAPIIVRTRLERVRRGDWLER